MLVNSPATFAPPIRRSSSGCATPTGRGAMDEFLRFEPPVGFMARTVMQDTD